MTTLDMWKFMVVTKSKKDKQPKNREPELEERELKWPKKQFEVERRKKKEDEN